MALCSLPTKHVLAKGVLCVLGFECFTSALKGNKNQQPYVIDYQKFQFFIDLTLVFFQVYYSHSKTLRGFT